jgi:hypothetical protein
MDIDQAAEAVAADQASAEYLGRWHRLVSSTNWEKGRIICDWRRALEQAAAPQPQWSDEAWSRRVGQVSPQHVGRLRRVYERFDAVREQFPKLYWSHFQAALDWNDAEMWLEGAVQCEWSVSEMRRQRWQALGAPDEMKPREEDVIASEWDEDAPAADAHPRQIAAEGTPMEIRRVDDDEDADYTDAAAGISDASQEDASGALRSETPRSETRVKDSSSEPLRPFAALADLPDDLAEACETFKLAILRHKLAGWTEVSRSDVLAALDALKQLATAPSEEGTGGQEVESYF